VAQWAKAVRARKGSRADVDSFASFENAPWAAELWAAAKDQYSFAAVRDPANLNVLYPPGNHRFVRLRVVREGAILGWVIGAERHVPGDPQYGDLRVTTVVDCWARPEHARIVMRSAVEALASSGADLLVSNQSCVWWQQALQASGFFAGPSNFIFAAPKKLIELLQPFEEKRARMHLTRADGDGLYRYCFDESPALNRETLSYSS
jgi:hypothetical protein